MADRHAQGGGDDLEKGDFRGWEWRVGGAGARSGHKEKDERQNAKTPRKKRKTKKDSEISTQDKTIKIFSAASLASRRLGVPSLLTACCDD
jgi:hypothetical protein